MIESVDQFQEQLAKGEVLTLPQLAPENLEELYTYAYNYYESGKLSQAINIFRYLTLFEMQRLRNWMGLGAALQMDRQYENALEAYRYALLIESDDPYLYIHAADCYFGLDQVDEGVKAIGFAKVVAERDESYAKLLPQLETILQRWKKKRSK